MKAIQLLLILCLFASLNCDILDNFKCLISNPKMLSIILKIVKGVKEKKFDILELLADFDEIVKSIKKCF